LIRNGLCLFFFFFLAAALSFGCDTGFVTAETFSTCKGLLLEDSLEVGMGSIVPEEVRGMLVEAEDVAAIIARVTTDFDSSVSFYFL
jgi:hypothetical protein